MTELNRDLLEDKIKIAEVTGISGDSMSVKFLDLGEMALTNINVEAINQLGISKGSLVIISANDFFGNDSDNMLIFDGVTGKALR